MSPPFDLSVKNSYCLLEIVSLAGTVTFVGLAVFAFARLNQKLTLDSPPHGKAIFSVFSVCRITAAEAIARKLIIF